MFKKILSGNILFDKTLLIKQKGQFFSPDLIIAMFIFVLAISFFFVSSENAYKQISYFEDVKKIEEVAHTTMNFLVYSPGIPANWQYNENINDVNFLGLVDERNQLSQSKLEKFVEFFDVDYASAKQKIGLREFDFKLTVIDSNSQTIFLTGEESTTLKSLVYDRSMYYLGKPVIVRGVFSYEN